MKFSIIIPVYNVENYIEETVKSALFLEETGEIILIEDGSKDSSYEVCTKLANEYEKVKLFIHENRQNKGVSATRNLGIAKATYEYISFLDADDLYLPNRFTKAKELFTKYPDIDGIYEAVGKFFDNEEAKKIRGENKQKLTTVRQEIKPEDLFEALLIKNIGHIHTSGITVKKTIFTKTGYFDENLIIGEDTAMWFKMAALGKLIPGTLNEPVSMYRLMSESLSSSGEKVLKEIPLMWQTLWDWGYQNNLDSAKLDLLFYRHVEDCLQLVKQKNLVMRKLYIAKLLIKLWTNYPEIIHLKSFWQYVSSLIGWQKIKNFNKYNT